MCSRSTLPWLRVKYISNRLIFAANLKFLHLSVSGSDRVPEQSADDLKQVENVRLDSFILHVHIVFRGL